VNTKALICFFAAWIKANRPSGWLFFQRQEPDNPATNKVSLSLHD